MLRVKANAIIGRTHQQKFRSVVPQYAVRKRLAKGSDESAKFSLTEKLDRQKLADNSLRTQFWPQLVIKFS